MEKGVYTPHIVGLNFRKLRIASGWGQEKLALELGYTNNSQLSEFEKGKGMLPMDKLKHASDLIGVPIDLITSQNEYTNRQAAMIVKFAKMLKLGENGFQYFAAIEELLNKVP